MRGVLSVETPRRVAFQHLFFSFDKRFPGLRSHVATTHLLFYDVAHLINKQTILHNALSRFLLIISVSFAAIEQEKSSWRVIWKELIYGITLIATEENNEFEELDLHLSDDEEDLEVPKS